MIVGTPGRMLELADAKKLKLHHLHAVVFDEADELLTDETLTLVVHCSRMLLGAKFN